MGLTKIFWPTAFTYAKCAGYKKVFFRATNRVAGNIAIGMGAKVIKIIYVNEPGV